MTGQLGADVDRLLTRLEDLELPLLAWGVVDGHLEYDEVARAIEEELLAARPGDLILESDIEAMLDELLAAHLLHRVPGRGIRQYRTRLAESLRLLVRLRQLFPIRDDAAPDWWRSRPQLVADFRILFRPRRFPVRTQSAEDLLAEMQLSTASSTRIDDEIRRIISERLLAPFQVRATAALLSMLEAKRSGAVIVTAGTGSGKTLAFYLPALAYLCSKPASLDGVQVLALYPRTELLRDQAREAIREVQRVAKANGRNVRIGVLYAKTPWKLSAHHLQQVGWQKQGTAFVAPYFPCPDDSCLGDMLLRVGDLQEEREVLRCAKCSSEVDARHIALTREAMLAAPPDILFTTTEMLNRHATGTSLGGLLGWRGRPSVRLVLLDEAHTYSGTAGAQVALLLRRWKDSVASRGGMAPPFVGLSATLREPVAFFSQLTGVEPALVTHVEPAESELESRGREYNIVLRSDPVSGASVLSTTIQTTMLLARSLDLRSGIFGSTSFVFTDDLDVNNRLYDDLHDAEGRVDRRGNERGQTLAKLRLPMKPHHLQRYQDGQSWDLQDEMRPGLRGLRIGRTSSQDVGVDSMADVIVATASLEVGFNDSRVGLVVQHKSPRAMANFLQRKGRAGRSSVMRPITAVVLSDWGRDRLAYQAYERLLDPEIELQRLPVGNRYVQKMHAAYALVEWLAKQLPDVGVRDVLSAPKQGATAPSGSARDRVLRELLSLADDAAKQDLLQRHLERALGLSPMGALALMWDQPRSIMLSVVPTLLKQLRAGWVPLSSTVVAPMPGGFLTEFVSRALFEPLNTPDVQLALPERFGVDENPFMPMSSALREAVPGRVSRRFGYRAYDHRTWLALPELGDVIELADIVVAGQQLGTFTSANDEGELLVVRPIVLRLGEPPAEVDTSSSATPIWSSHFKFPDRPEPIDSIGPNFDPWRQFVTAVDFALHANGEALEVTRMATGAVAETRYSDGRKLVREVAYTHRGDPAALGFTLEVDALRVHLLMPHESVFAATALSAGWRTRAFFTAVAEDSVIPLEVGRFQRAWLAQLFVHACARAVASGISRTDLADAVTDLRWTAYLDEYLRATGLTDPGQAVAVTRVVRELTELCSNREVVEVVEAHGRLLWADEVPSSDAELLQRAFADTLAGALWATALEFIPDAQDKDLVADVASRSSTEFEIVLSETEPGGLGIVEALSRRYAQDPRRFWRRVQSQLEPTENERLDASLRWLLAELVEVGESELVRAVADYRTASGATELTQATESVLHAWSAASAPPSHLEFSSASTKLFRPGTSPATDQTVHTIVGAWVGIERAAGFEIDQRSVVALVQNGVIAVAPLPGGKDSVLSVLWNRGSSMANANLENWNPYAPNSILFRDLLASAVSRPVPEIDVLATDWLTTASEQLRDSGDVVLTAPEPARDAMARAIRVVSAAPIDLGALRVYARLLDVQLRGGLWRATLELIEESQ